jgi:hypothetical protein
MEPTLDTETSQVKTQTPGKFPEESTLVSQRGENLKTYTNFYLLLLSFKFNGNWKNKSAHAQCWSLVTQV